MGAVPTPDSLIIGSYASFPAHTPEELQQAVSDAIYYRRFVRIWYGDADTGKLDKPPKSIVEGFIRREPNMQGLPILVQKGATTGQLLEVLRVIRMACIVRKKTPVELKAAGVASSTVMTAEPGFTNPCFDPGLFTLKNDNPGVYVALWEGLPVKVFTSYVAAQRYISLARGDVIMPKG